MDAAGTLQEVRDFAAHVDEVRELSGRPIAIVIVHHENKGGKVSGAWEGVGDTLLHVQQQGHARLRLYVQKARWASEQHATTLQLAWAGGDGFALAEDALSRPERVWDEIATYVREHGGCRWSDVEEAVSGQGDYKRRRRDEMLAEGVLRNAGSEARMQLWHRDDPAAPATLRPDADANGTRTASAPEGGGSKGVVRSERTVRVPASRRIRDAGADDAFLAPSAEPEEKA
jgi:hypothetical protein